MSIKDIYAGIPSCIANKYSSVQIMQEELQMEASMLHVVPETKRIIEQERHKGNTIVFISDMYLPSRFLMEQLIRENIAEKMIYVSFLVNVVQVNRKEICMLM